MSHFQDAYHKTYEETAKVIHDTEKEVEEYWHILGPGLTTGASDDDPSGIATYSQTGAQYGFQFIWLALFTFPLMSVVQEMCARIGLVTGQGLAANIRKYYSRSVLYVCTILLLVANVFNIGADLGAMAEALRLIIPKVPFGVFVVLFGFLCLLLQIFTDYKQYAKYLKYLALVLFAYVISAFFITINWYEVAWFTLVPQISPAFLLDKETLTIICAILGTTISPYLFFWQTSQEVEEKILKEREAHQVHVEIQTAIPIETGNGTPGEVELVPQIEPKASMEEIRNMRIDVWSGMFISNVVMFFIIAVCSATLHASGITTIKTASEAAEALRPIAGNFAFILFAIGIIGTGMLAIPVLAGSSAYAVSESFGWKFGLYRKLKEAYAFYGIIALSTVVGIILNFVGLDPIRALIYSAVGNGLVAPVILFLIISLSSRTDIMGDQKNGKIAKTVGWITFALMALSALGVLFL